MQVTVLQMISDAMSVCGLIQRNEPPAPEDVTLGIRTFNYMLGEWSAQSLMIRATTLESFALTANKGSYTIGAGGDFNTGKPLTVHNAFLRDGAGVDHILDKFSDDEYDALEDKSYTEALPMGYRFDPGLAQQTSPPGLGTFYIYPVPDGSQAYTLFVRSDKYLTSVVNPTDQLQFEDAYFNAIKYCLAIDLWPLFHKAERVIPESTAARAKSAKQTVEVLNYKARTCRISVPVSGGGKRYKILSDTGG